MDDIMIIGVITRSHLAARYAENITLAAVLRTVRSHVNYLPTSQLLLILLKHHHHHYLVVITYKPFPATATDPRPVLLIVMHRPARLGLHARIL